MSGSINNTLDLLKQCLAKAADPAELAKAATFTQSTVATVGLQTYDLEAPAKNLYPVLTPLRNRIPRVSGKGGIQANWKAVVGLDAIYQFAGVMEGRRGALMTQQTAEYFAAYRTIGRESSVTYEADFAAEGFDDLRARAVNGLLQQVMLDEEKIILGGNTSLSLGVTPTPTLAIATVNGFIPATTTVSVICVALTTEGGLRSTLLTGLAGILTVTPTDGQGSFTTSGGSAQKSANATGATGGGTATNSVLASVTPVRGAMSYGWYWGAVGNETLGAITNTSQVLITTAAGTGTQTAAAMPTSDNSKSSLVFDGLLTIASNPAFGSYYLSQTPGLGLTPDGIGGIVEFDIVLKYFWDVLRLSPSKIIISSQEMINIRKKILGVGAQAAMTRFVFNVQQGQITGGGMPKGYLNPFAAGNGPAELPFELHPNMPAGTVLFDTDDVPYPMNNIGNIKQLRCRRDYYQIEWPKRTRQYEYGLYSDEVLQHYFPPAMGILTNLANI